MGPVFQTVRNEFVSATIDAAIDQSNLTALSNLLSLYNGPDASVRANIGRIRYVQHQAEHRPPAEKTTFITRTVARSLALKVKLKTNGTIYIYIYISNYIYYSCQRTLQHQIIMTGICSYPGLFT